MESRIIRGVRVALPSGIAPASVHIRSGKIVALAAYDEVPREACPEELGKSVLMPAFAPRQSADLVNSPQDQLRAHATALADTWTPMREQGQEIEAIIPRLCIGPMAVDTPADFFVWSPELVVVGSKPVRYGQLRQLIEAGICRYKDGVHFRE